jgi:cell wall-associated NlpC family hydrolase
VQRSLSRRLIAGSIATAAAIGVLFGEGSAVAAPKPPTPPKPVTVTTQGQVEAARGARDAVATEVGTLSAQIAQMENQLQVLQGKKEMAEQKYALAVSQLQQAQHDEKAADARLRQASEAVDAAHDKFVRSIQASYMSGDVDGTGGALLTADDPNALLEQGALQSYLTAHKADAVGEYQTATVARSNDQAAARRAVAKRKQAEKDAATARQAAFAAVAQAQSEEQSLQASKAAKQRELDAKEAELYTTAADRQRYLTYKAAYAKYLTDKKAYDDYLAEKAREAAARARAREAAKHHGGGSSGGGGGGGGGWSSGPAAPSGGSWSAAKAHRAVERARAELGVPYAWAGGGTGGPSWGVCDSSNGAPNDCNVRGFDCSGLAMYAWGQGWAHYAATQYTQAGSYHPSLGNLKPGDLLFWSFNGRISGIHHVAIYIGGGNIIQAPESGSYVMISSMWAPGSIFGATRPLT